MFHNKEFDQTDREALFTLGEGQIGYIRPMRQDELANLPAEADFTRAWGAFSASGEPLAVCDSPSAAWSFFADRQLVPVSVH